MFSWFKGEDKPKQDTSDYHLPEFYHGNQGPRYKVLARESGDDYEARIYEPVKWISTKIESTDHDDAIGQGFWKLFKYIGGKNEAKAKVAMTCPVRGTVTQKDDTETCTVTTSFFVDKAKECPAPRDETLFFAEEKECKYFVRHFGGYAKSHLWKENLEALKESLSRDGKRYVTGVYYTAGYDPPFRPWGRRNEVYLKAEAITPEDTE